MVAVNVCSWLAVALFHCITKSFVETRCLSSGCLKSKIGAIIMGKEDILSRWEEYIGDLFEDDRGERPEINKEMEGPPILKDKKIECALKSMKYGKATGPDNISVEMIEALEDTGINKLESIMNKMYNTGTIPNSLSRLIVFTLPKRAGTTECELHRTISLMSHITRLMLKVLMKRMKRPTRPEIADVQCGFTEGKRTTNSIFIIRNLIERNIEVQKDIFL